MDDKTAELRDIFIDTTGSDTVTENQEEERGSLTADDSDSEDRVAEIVATMREKYEFDTDLDDERLEEAVGRFYADESDAAIASALDRDEETVFEARMDLHLIRESDREAPFDLADLRTLLVEDASVEERADALETDEATVRHYSEVVEAELEATRANDRFRDEFAELLTDAELSDRYAQDAREDGLREATEDIETDVSF